MRFIVDGVDSLGNSVFSYSQLDSEIITYCSDCIDQLTSFYYLNRHRTIPTIERLQGIVNENPTLWIDLFEKIMNSLIFNKSNSDSLSRPLQSLFLISSEVADSYYLRIAATQPPEVIEKLKQSMIRLTTDIDVSLEPILRDQFCQKCKDFKTEVLSYLIL